jgi:guanine deaminase
MKRAIELARKSIHEKNGGPFGCVIVKNGCIIGEGFNRVTIDSDPTAHAEIVAIRHACLKLNDFQLTDCEIYSTCEPCPMCLGAIYWARPKAIYYGANRQDAAEAGFDDEFIYHELLVKPAERKIEMFSLERAEALLLFDDWKRKEDKTHY